MFAHRKKPLFPVKVGETNPKFAQKLLEQFGGRSGEFTAMAEYFVQSFACEHKGIRDMLLDIATEEISHLEMVGLMIEQLVKGADARRRTRTRSSPSWARAPSGPTRWATRGRPTGSAPRATSWPT